MDYDRGSGEVCIPTPTHRKYVTINKYLYIMKTVKYNMVVRLPG